MGTTTNLVLGGSGLIGKELQKQLLQSGEQTINLDIKEGTDLRTFSLEKYSDIDYVWFLAWDVGGAKYLYNTEHQIEILKNNTGICRNVFHFLEKYKIPFVFTSSQLANTDNSYGITKLLGELWTQQLCGKIVRFWNVYGWEAPSEKSHVIPDLITQALVNKKIVLLTNGNEERQFIYIEDCIRNLIKIRESNLNLFHLTNGDWLPIKKIAGVIADKLNVPLILGNEQGYSYKVNPDESYKLFDFLMPIDSGIEIILKKAKVYLQKQKINV
ncbi:MAG: NAD(P)-dependent oxidoreductase [Bacteroidales bacterium]